MLVLTLCSTFLVQAALAHSSPVAQTFRSGVTLFSFSGTFEVVWSGHLFAEGASIELRQQQDGVAVTLLQATESGAVETNSLCPGFSMTYTCTRMHLSGIPELAPGEYTIYWRVVHLDGYVEQRTVRFTVDPTWVSPSPSQPPSLNPSPATSEPTGPASPSPSPRPRPTPSASAEPPPSADGSGVPTTDDTVAPSVPPTPSEPDTSAPDSSASNTVEGIIVLIAVAGAVLFARAAHARRV